MSRVRVGVLVSGGGTNLQALLDDAARPDHPGEIAVVLSNRPDAYALQRAAAAGVPTEVLSHKGYADRASYDADLVATLRRYDVSWVCLAGFMRLLTRTFLDAFPGRVLNIHPALLPAFPGTHAQRQALQTGVRLAGATVHLVDEGTDTGPILAQGVVPVLPDDTEDTLSARILGVEHQLYPRVLRWACAGRIALDGRQARLDLPAGEQAWLLGQGFR